MTDPNLDPKALEAALSELRDLRLPAADSSVGPSPDTWATLSLLALAGVIAWLIRRHVLRSPRKLALDELNRLKRAHRGGAPARETISACNGLVRRFVVAMHPPETVAGLTGFAWQTFLDEISPPRARFSDLPPAILVDGPYRREPPSFDERELFDGLERWLRHSLTPHMTWFDKVVFPRQGLPPLYPE